MGKDASPRPRILLIGPLPACTETAENPIGGAAVNFAEMILQLSRRGFDLDVLDSSRPRTYVSRAKVALRDVSTLLGIACNVIWRAPRTQVIFFNTSVGRAYLAASTIWMISRVFRKPLALRFFGGDLALVYDSYGRIRRWWTERTYLRAARVFVQTDEVYSRFRKRANFRWFPNTRDVHTSTIRHRDRATKLLFISRLNMEKGLREAVEACHDLPADCHLNVFGPEMPDTDYSLFEGCDRVTYRGVLKPDDVPEVLAEHDVLLFPSYWRSEGHPGIVVEALQCGTPVVGSRWAGIPEIVEHGHSGLLVEPRSTTAVKAAVEQLVDDPILYRRLCVGAARRGEFFRSGAWYDRLAKDIRLMAETRPITSPRVYRSEFNSDRL